MKSIYNYDIKTWICHSLPTFLRKPKMRSWLEALSAPWQGLQTAFKEYRAESLSKITHTAQVALLRKALNDRFDPVQRRITIGDASGRMRPYFYSENANRPVVLGKAYLYGGIYSGGSYDFIVSAPFPIDGNMQNAVRAFIDFYKLPEKTYQLKTL